MYKRIETAKDMRDQHEVNKEMTKWAGSSSLGLSLYISKRPVYSQYQLEECVLICPMQLVPAWLKPMAIGALPACCSLQIIKTVAVQQLPIALLLMAN